MRQLAALVLFAATSACGSTKATPDGASLLKATFTTAQGGPPAGLSAKPTSHTHQLAVNPKKAAEVKVVLEVVKDPRTGGQYLHNVEVLVARNGDGAITATLPASAMPTNLGSHDVPIASNIVMIEWRRDRGLLGSQLGQTPLTLKADGTVTLL